MSVVAKYTLLIGCLSALLGVIFGAFGAHFLKTRIDEYSLSIFEVGVRYQFYHAFALILYAFFLQSTGSEDRGPTIAFTLGTLIFSGSLYALAFTGIKILGAITPIGGVAFIVGWVLWMMKTFKL